MRFKVVGPLAINGHAPGEEFDYMPGAPAWEDRSDEARPLVGAPFKWEQWVQSGFVIEVEPVDETRKKKPEDA